MKRFLCGAWKPRHVVAEGGAGGQTIGAGGKGGKAYGPGAQDGEDGEDGTVYWVGTEDSLNEFVQKLFNDPEARAAYAKWKAKQP